ncbi:MAG: adenylate kinase [Odoribacter sp.]|nr:adenylate kinase [Odoribacter sp.]
MVLFGPPGAGKGTQAKKIIEKYNLIHLSTGEMIRKEIREETELGKIAKSQIEQGKLLSDDFVVQLVIDGIERSKDANGFLFDGFPRTVAQAEELDKMLGDAGIPLKCLINIEVPFEELKRRMMGRAKIEGRSDDNEEAIAKRFQEYRDKTVHVAQYYCDRGLCYNIRGDRDVEEVFNAISELLDSLK